MAEKTLEFSNARHLSQLYCGRDANLQKVEREFNVEIVARDNWVKVTGENEGIEGVEQLFSLLNEGRTQGLAVRDSDFENMLHSVSEGRGADMKELYENPLVLQIKNKTVVPKNLSQKRYLKFIMRNDVVFGIGPAGTGKTYLAIAAALHDFLEGKVEKIILTRPAVEAGEALGFLPGDLQEKILPYLRPLYDAMEDMLGREGTQRLIEKGIIEVAPLAYMRGRTLSNAFVILDEAQNTTSEQMMMFLTRLGDSSRMIITGDITQVDLPRSKKSGLKQAVQILSTVEGIKLFYFDKSDVVRHPLVQKIIEAYSRFLDFDDE